MYTHTKRLGIKKERKKEKVQGIEREKGKEKEKRKIG